MNFTVLQVTSPNLSDNGPGASWGLISVPLSVPTLEELREKFNELSKVIYNFLNATNWRILLDRVRPT